ncbi:MAG: tRNA (5-methylaminomethyl-2-thiouridine)(34)-methyltransferase MnmD [Muribaculaceae bacterium]|nr:tRNA (5-methylaminomethyl-2-thiouridine)(34)-methyltransferase MnmD [Muribaculaceae bacterium]
MNLNIEKTADGSVTLYREDLDEHYHSVKGALTESLHVYIDMAWRKFAERQRYSIRVFEVGFGTGLNAALTAKTALDEKIKTEYFAVELHPLPSELSSALLDRQLLEYAGEYRSVNSAQWNVAVDINPYFTLHKISADLLTMILPTEINVVYFDAFAPEKQPEMWEEQIFQKIHDAMAPGAILTSYCAKGSIRRLLQNVGFITERLPGPPGGKREILRATRNVS